MSGALRLAMLFSLLALVLAPGASPDTPPGPCDPNTTPAEKLFAPAKLPTDYPSGFYAQHMYIPGQDPPGVGRGPFQVVVGPATPGGHTDAYTAGELDRDLYGRWPLKFARGDVAARITFTYTEENHTSRCIRQQVATVQPVDTRDPHIHLRRLRISEREALDKYGAGGFAVTARVRGTIRRSARKPVLIEIYGGNLIIIFRRVPPRHGVIRLTSHWFDGTSEGPTPYHVRALYPGDTDDSWPCDRFGDKRLGFDCKRTLRDPTDQY
ncbi:MAG: hypothetical protein ACJ77M_16300 [Thermoleophilaceae bacterium]